MINTPVCCHDIFHDGGRAVAGETMVAAVKDISEITWSGHIKEVMG